ncbi:Ig-like domain-containing protein [Brotaphodocola sp.]|uniref:Ig-like domain-containing protein n=1 Tax=Brotaphodocola sp. TaxID=3073577 RepID=UPI003D7C9908
MSFQGTTQEITLNMYGAPSEGRYVEVQQGDTSSRTVRFYLKTFGDAEFAIPPGASVQLCVSRTDKKTVVCDGTVEKEGGNSVLVTLLPEACACAGKQAAQLCIYSQDGDIRSQIFYLRAPEAVYKKGTVNPSDDDEETSGLSKEEKDLLLTLLKSAAYTSDEMEGAYNALKDIWNAKPAEKVYYTVTNALSNVINSSSATSVREGSVYGAVLTPVEGYTMGSVKITMGDEDITSTAYTASSGAIRISAVTGNIVITATAMKKSQNVAVQSVTLDKQTASLIVGGSLTLKATVLPADATDKTVKWTSSSSVATVSDGTVKAVSVGSAEITATAGEKSATCKITIAEATVAVQSVSFAQTSGSLEIGKSLTLVPVITPSNATDKTVTWKSSKPAVASVEGGLVKALTAGSADITATAGGKTATYALTVPEATVEDETLVYSLPDETVFEPSAERYIDTGVKLFESIEEKPSWTILMEVQYGDNAVAASDTYCLAHCMNESSPWPGLSISAWADGALGVNVYGGKSQFGTMTKLKAQKRKLALKLEGTTGTRWNVDGTSATFSISNYNTAVDKTLILGAYQTSDGEKGRYFDGTLFQFLVYKKAMSDEDITAWLNE